jgi:polyribonucleotide nucleotidyltransferase
MFNEKTVEVQLAGKTFSISTGKIAKQAGGAVIVRHGDTVVLVTATAADKGREGIDFFPLTCNYQEQTYAAGRIPGGFWKREGRPREKEILTSRLIDRPIRPLFPKAFINETQVIATVLSVDEENDPDVLALTGASAALSISDIPFAGPVASVRIGMVDGELVVNPSFADAREGILDMVVAASEDAIVMVEGGADQLSEAKIIEALKLAHSEIKGLIKIQKELVAMVGKTKREVPEVIVNQEAVDKVKEFCSEKMNDAIRIGPKLERYKAYDKIKAEMKEALITEDSDKAFVGDLGTAFGNLKKTMVRNMYFEEDRRIDGRAFDEIREIICEVGILPRTHGSALFTRGETQAIVVATLGTSADEQIIDDLEGERSKTFMLHYNFPPYCVGEVKRVGSPNRREIGHGALAERSLRRIVPTDDDFPYTLRVVSDIMESNGSSSMASVCGGTLSLMDAGVPIKTPVAGIAMGLMQSGDKTIVLSDIMGDEDHMGDMDFKVTGSSEGITAIQMDIKIEGLSFDIVETALEQARVGRLHILGKMAEALPEPRAEINANAPRISSVQISIEKIRDIIGPGGKTIRCLQMETGTIIEVDDMGKVTIASPDQASLELAQERINLLTAVPEIGQKYQGVVKRIADFGAFVEVLPNVDGLVHISMLGADHVQSVRDVVNEGDVIEVEVIDVDRDGRVRLATTEALAAGKRDMKAGGGGGRGGRDNRGGGRDNRGRGGDNRRR